MTDFMALAVVLALITVGVLREIVRRLGGARGTPAAIALSAGYFLVVLEAARWLVGERG